MTVNVTASHSAHAGRIVYLAMGGTISAVGSTYTYTAGKRSGHQLLQEIGIDGDIAIPDLGHSRYGVGFPIDSKDLRAAHLFAARDFVLEHLPAADSIVISHGTDTLAFMTYFLALTTPPALLKNKRIVLTASALPSNHPQADGPGNLTDAFVLARTAAGEHASGVFAVMNHQIFQPPFFEKRHSSSISCFSAVNGAVVGSVNAQGVQFFSSFDSGTEPVETAWFDLGRATSLPDVGMIPVGPFATVEATLQLIQFQAQQGVRGLVIHGPAEGEIDARILSALAQLVTSGMPVVLAAGVGAPALAAHPDKYAAHGFVCAGRLEPYMAGLLLQVCLAAGTVDLEQAFSRYQTSQHIDTPKVTAATSALPPVGMILTGPNASTAHTIRTMQWLVQQGVKALIVQGSGNGTLDTDIEAEMKKLAAAGTLVVRASRVGAGPVIHNGAVQDDENGFLCAGTLLPQQAAALIQSALHDAQKNTTVLDFATAESLFAPHQVYAHDA